VVVFASHTPFDSGYSSSVAPSTMSTSTFYYPAVSTSVSVSESTSASTSDQSSTQETVSDYPTSTSASYGYGSGGGRALGPTSTTSTDCSASSSPPVSLAGYSIDAKLVGGIVGGLIGFALILVGILILIKRRKRRLEIQARVDAGYGGPPPSAPGGSGIADSISFAASFFTRPSRQSDQTQYTVPSERGFEKLAGRKLPPAIGGPRLQDGYSGRSLEGPSFFHEGEAGPATPVSSTGIGPLRYSATTSSLAASTAGGSTALPTSAQAPSGSVVVARSRLKEEFDGPEGQRAMTPPDFAARPQLGYTPVSRDGLGRSLASHDGSRASRFTEDIV
jgi:hypothetical protein